ncbi:MAG: hypothetical protein HYW02_06415 [Deltaproteobacteria bacterium]|nr:hypothetical protein [Deltaproteobacteria bacterium]MBI2501084.1 hypothetical protein [Deltaproteobacteria bacterium]
MKRWPAILLVAVLITGCASSRHSLWRGVFQEEIQEAKRQIQIGQSRQAIDELSMLLEIDPDNLEALFLRASAYQRFEEFHLAILDYQHSLKKDPDFEKAHFNLGMIYAFKLRDREKGLAHLDQFLSLNPDHPAAFAAAKAMRWLDQETEAAEIETSFEKVESIPDESQKRILLEKWIEKHPDSARGHYLLATVLLTNHEEEKALQEYKMTVRLSPTFAEAHRSLGQLLLKRKKEEGRIHLKKAALFAPHETAGSIDRSDSSF